MKIRTKNERTSCSSSRRAAVAAGTSLVVLGAIVAASSCTTITLNDDYCSVTNGNVFCANRHGDERPYCIWGTQECRDRLAQQHAGDGYGFDGCIATPPPPEGDECYSPCGGGPAFLEEGLECPAGAGTAGSATEGAEGGSEATEAMTSTSAATTAPEGTTGVSGCTEDTQCEDDPGGPFCDPMSGECVTCDALGGDVACAEADPMRPICYEGGCVECAEDHDDLCRAELHVCNADTNECEPCTVHEECEIGACHIFEGTCFPNDAMSTTVFTIEDGNCDIAMYLEGLSTDYGVVFLGGYDDTVACDMPAQVSVGGGRVVALLKAPGQPRPWLRRDVNDIDVIGVYGNAALYLQDIRVSENVTDATPLACGGARLDARETIIAGNEEGILLEGCEARLENCFVQSLRDHASALNIRGESDVSIVYSSLVTRAGGDDNNDAVLSCADGSEVWIRNSLLISQGGGSADEIDHACASFVIEHSIVESMPVFGVGNDNLEPPISGTNYEDWFLDFDSGDLHLNDENIGSALADVMAGLDLMEVAVPMGGDSPTDIDGEMRSASEHPGMVGADVP